MFVIVFVLFFSKTLQVNAIQCMTNEAGDLFSIFDSNKCGFDLNSNGIMHTDEEIEGLKNCKTREAGSGFLFGSTGSCYGQVTIDYTSGLRSFYFTHVPYSKLFLDPYNDMFGFFHNAESVVQYRIKGSLENNTFHMTTRVQCKTGSNCATAKIRSLLANLTLSDPRKAIFQQLRHFLIGNDASPPSSLT